MTSRVLCRVNRALERAARVGPVLGLDTAGPVAGVGLVADGVRAGERWGAAGSHAAALPLMAAELLRATGHQPGALGGVAVGIGPGSFTGLRVGLSYAKGLALGAGCRLVGVPSLDAMAAAALDQIEPGTGCLICPLIDARREQVYAGFYRVDGDRLEKVSGALLIDVDALAARVAPAVIFVGGTVAERARQALASRCDGAPAAPLTAPTGAAVAALGAAAIAGGVADDPRSLEPIYPDVARLGRPAAPAAGGRQLIWSTGTKNSYGVTPATTNN